MSVQRSIFNCGRAWPRIILVAAIVAALTGLTFAATGSAAERCWGLTTQEENTPYADPYPYGTSSGSGYNIPDCRYGYLGMPDRTDYDNKNANRAFDDLNQNPSYGNRRIWAITDSFWRTLGYIEHANGQWQVRYSPTGTVVFSQPYTSGRLTLQGKACMDDESLRQNRAVVSFDPTDTGHGEIEWRIRGFVLISALPSAMQTIANDSTYDTGCPAPGDNGQSQTPITNPNYGAATERFVGEDDVDRAYQTWNAKANYGNAIYVARNTVGVHGGGAIVGVVRAGVDTAQIEGWEAYCDQNTKKTNGTTYPHVMAWWIAAIYQNGTARSRLGGWVPVRASCP